MRIPPSSRRQAFVDGGFAQVQAASGKKLLAFRGEAFLNLFQQSMQQDQDFHLGLRGDSLGHWFCVAPRRIPALERGQAGNGRRAVASRA
jgi:hypothetical protein